LLNYARGLHFGEERNMLHILGTIIIGFVAGVIAKLVTPGDREPKGFILTTILGIVGAFVATYLGQAIGWYGPDQNAGFIGAIVGAVIILGLGAYSGGTGNDVVTWCLEADILSRMTSSRCSQDDD